jgi:hypothetical protein
LVLEGLVDGLSLASGDESILLGDQVIDNGLEGGLQVLDLTLDLDRVGQGDGGGTVDSLNTLGDCILSLLGSSEERLWVTREALDGGVEVTDDSVDAVYDTNDGLDLTLQDGGTGGTRGGEEGECG